MWWECDVKQLLVCHFFFLQVYIRYIGLYMYIYFKFILWSSYKCEQKMAAINSDDNTRGLLAAGSDKR
jgi:hypothetical protein